MNRSAYLLSYDVGTTGVKTCLFVVQDVLALVATSLCCYPLYISEGGGAEQDPLDWLSAIEKSTKEVLAKSGIDPSLIAGISFCSQMQGLVLVDEQGNALRNAFSYLDQRSTKELKEGLAHGLQVAGANVFKLLYSLAITGAVATSVKDPVWKYQWVRNNEPELFSRIHKWLDVKEYLIAQMTGSFVMTEDSAFATLLLDVKKRQWSPSICKMLKVNPDHLPDIVLSTDQVGTVTEKAAARLGLAAGTPVFGGGGDAAVIGLGAGSTKAGDCHIYMGTSGWVSTVVPKSMVDPVSKTAAIVSAVPGMFTYFSELETAGKCLEWVRDHLALDEINIYLDKTMVTDSPEAIIRNLYDYMDSVISTIGPGSGGVIFTPWLHGNRCPFEDSKARGMFFNIGLDTGKTEMIRAVTEGVCFHLRWFLEVQEKKVKTSETIRFVGGGALSPVTCQILSDILGRRIETIESPQNVGALGASLVAALGLGFFSSADEAVGAIVTKKTYEPDFDAKRIYDGAYAVFKALYKSNRKHFSKLN
ncbi:MAG TPA: FGGY-family carbohydrate kinase [Sphaerochaeta sp.]|nr:FGGY-family carbohydrate kinase [Sphaerochaeta sp.]